jgi:hypothetical protein
MTWPFAFPASIINGHQPHVTQWLARFCSFLPHALRTENETSFLYF